jgi:3-oxoacyl-[acyl-carrier protein] reductase
VELDLRGARAVLTGASEGIGLATSATLAASGVQLVLVARREDRLREVVKEIVAVGHAEPVVVAVDVTDPQAPAKIRAEAVDAFGGVDILINNAGQTDPAGSSLSEEFWRHSFELNFHSKRRLAEALLEDLAASGRGRIINFIGSMEPMKVSAGFAAVAATRVWSKGLSRVVARQGITVNCVSPGRVDSAQLRRNNRPETLDVFVAENVPVGRVGHSLEAAWTVAFLASVQSSYITGETIHVDGGLHRHAS